MWPMLAVAAPLLGGDGTVGYFTDRSNDRVPWRLEGGRVLHGPDVVGARWDGTLRTPDGLAVRTGPGTASSGEAVAIAFRGMVGVRSFGSPTAGFSTGNIDIRLPGDMVLVVTTTRFVDRTGVVHGGALVPDEAAPDALSAARRALA